MTDKKKRIDDSADSPPPPKELLYRQGGSPRRIRSWWVKLIPFLAILGAVIAWMISRMM